LAVVTLAATAAAFAADKPAKGIEGAWLGTLKVSSIELRIAFRISRRPDGTLTALLDSIDQGAKGIPVDKVAFKGAELRLESTPIKGVYQGTLDDEATTLQGTWTQAGQTWPLTLRRVETVPELRRPQNPARPYPYKEEEVVYENRKAKIKLAATLTLPKGEGRFPAVVLITGSGPQDRDETVFGHKPFLVLADHLTRRGIAVLRADDRGVGKSTGDFTKATSGDFAEDARAGLAYLKTRSRIDPKRIGLIGHSEGGMIAPMVAAECPDVAFVVMMAGIGQTGEQLLYSQSELILRTEGAGDNVVTVSRSLQEGMFKVLKQEKDNAVAEKKIRKLMEEAEAKLTEEESKWQKSLGPSREASVEIALSPWFRHFIAHDPRPVLMKVKCPVLAINGEKDVQVPPGENLGAIDKALKVGGNKDYTIRELKGLNHLFQTAKTGALGEYGMIEETISPTALKLIADWILARTKRQP
jgi:hypothetical protein